MAVPSDEMLRITRKSEFLREIETFSPVHDLSVSICGLFRAEWRPSDKAFKHDRPDRPPIAKVSVSLSIEYFGSNVVWSANRRVSHRSTRLSPGIYLASVGNSQVDGVIEKSGIAVFVLRGGSIFQKRLIIGIVMLLLAASRQSKVSKLDVSATIQKNIVRLDITVSASSQPGIER